MHRRSVLLGASAFAVASALPAFAANVAEDFVSANVQAGFDILNDKTLDVAARKQRFAAFLLNLTDVKRVALFLIGKTSAPQADIDAYLAAYQDYILAVYQSYFAQYAGQSLKVVSSRARAADDYIVSTTMTGGGNALPVEFRVRTDGAKPVLVDLSVMGVWLAENYRNTFADEIESSSISALIEKLASRNKALNKARPS